jgi:hypothetical protein
MFDDGHLFLEKPCIDCQDAMMFPGLPSEAICSRCGLWMYITADGLTGRYPGPESFSWGLQRRRRDP